MASHYYQLDRATGLMVKKHVGAEIKKEVFNKTFTTRKHADVPSKKKSIYRGVCFCYEKLKWRAQISIKGLSISLGNYDEERDAALAYDHRAIQLGRKTNILQALT